MFKKFLFDCFVYKNLHIELLTITDQTNTIHPNATHLSGVIRMSIYIENGYKNRRDYLECIADDYGIDTQRVFALATILGADEDFDGLICALEDIEDGEF